MKLEAISLMKLLPAGAADVGGVTRQQLRDAGVGQWSAQCEAVDDLRAAIDGPEPDTEIVECPELEGYDRPTRIVDAKDEVVELRLAEG